MRSIAGLAAAIMALAQVAGGVLVPYIRRVFVRRTTWLVISTAIVAGILVTMGFVGSFWIFVALVIVTALLNASMMPIRQTYLNSLIPSKQRATVLSFDSLVGSSGGIVSQPVLGKSADVWGYGTSYMIAGILQLGALPFLLLASRFDKTTDK